MYCHAQKLNLTSISKSPIFITLAQLLSVREQTFICHIEIIIPIYFGINMVFRLDGCSFRAAHP